MNAHEHRWIAVVAALWTGACGGAAPAPEAPPPQSLFKGEGEANAKASADGAADGSADGPAGKTPSTPAGPVNSGSHNLEFTDIATTWGIDLRHHAGRNPERWIPETISGGVALLDVDRNGALDILLVDGGQLGKGDPAPDIGPRLLLGDGRGGFSDATERFGLEHRGYGMGVAAGDIDNDGWVDLYLTTFDATDRLLRNDAGQRFVDVTAEWGIEPEGWSTSAAMLDIDADGDLDLYVVRYVRYALDTAIKCWFRTIHVYCTPGMYEALPDRLYRNEGGRFVEVPLELTGSAKGLAVATGDLDDDGDVDLYVADDISRNLLLLNDGTGKFEDSGVLAGVAYSELGREEASMGVAVSDSDADGQWDLAVTNFQAEPTSLYVRRKGGSYRERSDAAGIGASARARLSFGIEWLDADNDGDEDLVTANGHVTDNVSTYREQVQFAQLNSLYERTGDGRFEDVSARAGSGLAVRGVSRGLAVGDLDGDGGVDYVIVDNDGAVQVARNTTQGRGHWLSLWLEGTTANRSAIGTQLTVTVGDRTMRREVRGATSYLSVSDRRVHLGLGDATRVDQLELRWPDGQVQRLGPLDADAHLHVVQGQPPVPYVPGAEVRTP